MNDEIGYLQIVLESTITFFVLLVMTRALGNKQLSHLTFFNYIAGITIGSIAANMILLNTMHFLKELVALAMWCLLTTLIGFLGLKSGKLRVLFDGQPTILVKRGVIDRKALARTRLNMDDLLMMIRQQNVFSIAEIDYAILEPNGTLSVLKKFPYQPTQKSDVEAKQQPMVYLPSEIIVDGKVVRKNLRELGLSEDWLNTQLTQANTTAGKVFYAEIQADGSLFLQR